MNIDKELYFKKRFCEAWEEVTVGLEATENVEYCYICPFYDRCSTGHNGFLDYIDEVKSNVI